VDQTFIEGLLDLFERSALAELEYSEGDSRIRLVKHPSGSLPGARPPARPMADRAGRIAEIKPEDGALVEPGAPLFVLVPADGTGV